MNKRKKKRAYLCQDINFDNADSKGPVTQNSASKSRTKSHENLVDVVVSGNFWSILAWPCFERGLAVSGCSTAETLPKHGLPLPATCKVKNRFARV
jgi:hypothetical protein